MLLNISGNGENLNNYFMKNFFRLFGAVLLVLFVLGGCAAAVNNSKDGTASVLSSTNNDTGFTDHNLSPGEAKDFIAGNAGSAGLTILDVRSPEERKEGCLKDSVNIDFNSPSFAERIGGLDKDQTYLVYCRSGRRSGETIKLMENSGFKNVYNLDGGISGWQSQGGETDGTC